jgi:hypothetical protein
LSRNSYYPDFGGTDCTNFVSQALHAGGFSHVGGTSETSLYQWWIRRNSWGTFDYATTWSVAWRLRQFLINDAPGGTSEGTAPGKSTNPYTPASVVTGDVLFYDWGQGEGISHASIQVGIGRDPAFGYYGDYMPERPRRSRAWLSVILLATSVAGCSEPRPADTAHQAPSRAASVNTSGLSNMPALLQAVDQHQSRIRAEGTVRINAGARPTVVSSGNSVRTMVIRDEDGARWARGSYRLDVSCAGTGSLVAFLGVGANAQIKELAPCSPDVTTDFVQVDVPSSVSGGGVVITPVGDTRAAVAYQVVKV